MNIELIRATADDAHKLWQMQIRAFKELFEKYQDFDTSPGNEPLDKTIFRLSQQNTYFYFIIYNSLKAGAIRVVDNKDNVTSKRISPIFVMPEFRNMGIAQKAILAVEEIHGSDNWELDTIMQEKGNCYLYEKMGYSRTGKTENVNDKLTLVFYKKWRKL